MHSLRNRFQEQALIGNERLSEVVDLEPARIPAGPPGTWLSVQASALQSASSPERSGHSGDPPKELPWEERLFKRRRSISIKKGQKEYKKYRELYPEDGPPGPAPRTPDPEDSALAANRKFDKQLEHVWWHGVKQVPGVVTQDAESA